MGYIIMLTPQIETTIEVSMLSGGASCCYYYYTKVFFRHSCLMQVNWLSVWTEILHCNHLATVFISFGFMF